MNITTNFDFFGITRLFYFYFNSILCVNGRSIQYMHNIYYLAGAGIFVSLSEQPKLFGDLFNKLPNKSEKISVLAKPQGEVRWGRFFLCYTLCMYNDLQRAAWVEVSLSNIRDNYLAIRSLAPESEALVCVKANAYGHGLVKTAWELVRCGVEYLGIATVAEAVELRSAGISTNIVLLSALPRGNTKDALDLDLITVITAYEDAKLLSEATKFFGAKKALRFFVALETGMGRLGFMPTPEALADIAALTSLPGINMLGTFSHFATADAADLSFARKQLAGFNEYCARLHEAGIETGKRSMANSAAIMTLPDSHFDIIRPGISLYGIYPSDSIDKSILTLKPAMTIKPNIVYLKKTPAGFPVSYGSRFVTQRESLIATIPIGYGDGLPRYTRGNARVLVHGHYAPIVGVVCMDQCMVDVTDVPGVCEYDEVVLLGEQEGAHITAEELAADSGTITNEVVCRFDQRLPTKYL